MDFEAMCEACPHHEKRPWDEETFWWWCTTCDCWSADSHIVSKGHLKKCANATPLWATQHPQGMAWMESPEPREVSPSTGKDMAPPPPREPPPEPSPGQPPSPPPHEPSPRQVPGALEATWAVIEQKCQEKGITVTDNDTKGSLMRKLRAAQEVEERGSDETIVGFGQHAKNMYKDVPKTYLKWVMQVLREDPECQGQLARLAAWAKMEGIQQLHAPL